MRITVTVFPGSGANRVVPQEDGNLRVFTSIKPQGGKANEAVIALIAKHYKVARGDVRIIIGKTAREKLVEISSQ